MGQLRGKRTGGLARLDLYQSGHRGRSILGWFRRLPLTVRRTAMILGVVIALIAVWLAVSPDSAVVADPSEGFIDDVPSTTPENLGDLDLTELQYADPVEALALIQPPKASVDGGASLAHPLPVPPGRADVQPDLALTYNSNGGSGWVGIGWDLSVGAVTVDTEFGAPRYLLLDESETYLLDGDRLFPNAIRTELAPRVSGKRADWVRQIEDDHDLIIRHGTAPDDYCWEVVDTEGNHQWYGGAPNGSGGCARDPSAILTASPTGLAGGVDGDYHWALTYVEDISGNIMRFSYDKLTGVEIGLAASADIGVSLYLREIHYTGFNLPTAPDQPAYVVRFLRDGDVPSTARFDVSVDASTGQPVVIRDLLRRIEVKYLSPGFYSSGAPEQLVKGWTLQYVNGPFDKSLLTSVGQYGKGGPGNEHAWHEFTWFDDVTTSPGNYVGFADAEEWGKLVGETGIPNIAAQSALGTSWRAGADGGAYIGFNPIAPSKILSFGGSFNIAGGQTNEVSILVDLDGDGLPDKVWVSGGTVMYRPNLNRPGALDADKFENSWFGPAQAVQGIDSLGRSSDLRIDIHFEAYPIVAIQVGGGFGFSFGDRYFEDVNGDGRVDFIKPGDAGGHTVFYNVLDDNGLPYFVDSSAPASAFLDRLEVPLDPFDSTLANTIDGDVADFLINTSPRIDTVRRWLAPHTGRIRVTGTAALTTPSASYRGDGAQVTIEYGEAQLWTKKLNRVGEDDGISQSHSIEIDVTAGEPVWFRLHVIDNAAGDEISWDPTVTYISGFPLSPALDANGRSQIVFSASADFTLFGRSGARTAFAEAANIDVTVKVNTFAKLSDDLEVIIFQGHGDNTPIEHPVLIVPQASTPNLYTGVVNINIAAPTKNKGDDDIFDTEDDFDENDFLDIQVRSKSPIDPTKFSVEITTTAGGLEPPDPANQVILAEAGVEIPLDIPLVPNVRVFSRTDHTQPYEPVTSPTHSRHQNAEIKIVLDGPKIDDGNTDISSEAVLTVKTLTAGSGGIVEVLREQSFTVAHSGGRLKGNTTISNFDWKDATTYYIEVSVADPIVGAGVDLVTSKVTFKWTVTVSCGENCTRDETRTDVRDNAGQLHWPDADRMFPSGNRGWAYAGYNADHADANGGGPLVEDQFAFDAESDGFDKDTEVPSAGDAPSAGGVKGDIETSFDPSLPYIPWAGPMSDIADRWRAGEKETLHGTGTIMQADRLGADTPIPGQVFVGRQAPQMLSLDGDFNFMLGLVVSFSAAAGGGRELKGYEDFNGDSYPDIRNGSGIEFTGPRGGLAGTTNSGDNTFDLALALGGGLGGSAVAISNTGGSSKNDDGGANNVEATSTKSSRGMNLGLALGFSIGAQWTNPIANGEAYVEVSGGDPDESDVQGDLNDRDTGPRPTGATGTAIDRAYIDVNGDGLPDRVDTFSTDEMWVNLNLGYRFADEAIQWSTGRTSSNKDVGGSVSVGFQFNAYEFGGGVAYSEGVGYSLFDWTDIDGDGVPDRMDNVGPGQPRTVFGSGDGMQRTAIVYGDYPDGDIKVDLARFTGGGINLPEGQMEVSRSTGLSGGVDFSFYIGPICLVACYIVINPGIHAGYDRMTSQIMMIDMNGDGYLDAVRSTDPEDIEVRLNLRKRTNLLKSVTNPLGGQIRLDYKRSGNTIENPESLWVMSSIEVDDGRSGDGPSVQRSKFTYSGNIYDLLLREQLGFNFIREDQIDEDGTTVLRSYERDYLNSNPFETSLLTEERTLDASGNVISVASFQWTFANADPHGGEHGSYGSLVVGLPEVGTTARTLLFRTALSPRLVTDRLEEWDGAGRDDLTADSQSVETHYTYSAIGDVLTVHDENEGEVLEDDTFTVITYSDCAPRGGDRILVADETWVSVPQTMTVYGSDAPSGDRLRYRNGGPGLCVNATSLRIAELVDEDDGNSCGPLYAITELSFDTRGSYDAVARPTNAAPTLLCGDYPSETVPSLSDLSFVDCNGLAAADRYCVDYVYDAHRFTAIEQVTDNHGVTSSATYDPFTGRLASRTDENGNLTTYTYDGEGRLSTIVAPREQGTGTPTMTYAYGGLDAILDPLGAHAWATAHHHDPFNAPNTIDTVSFVDGMGRVVQRKRDAEVDGVAGEARIVEGAIEYDALGREVKEWYPVVEIDADFIITAYNTWTSSSGEATARNVPLTQPIARTFDALDRLLTQVLPDGSKETVEYDYDVLPDPHDAYSADITMIRITTTDPLGKATTRWLDVGGAVFFRSESAASAHDPDGGNPLAVLPTVGVIKAPRIEDSSSTTVDIKTAYEYDRLGRLVGVVDVAGARTEHTYDLQDAVTSTDTPDAGLVERTFAPSGQLLTVQRAVGTLSTYSYDRDRLIGVAYSDATPDVIYEYGNDGALENAVGRVTRIVDGSMERTYGYDIDGNVSRETATQDADPFGTGINLTPPTWATLWEYDSLSRLVLLTYPDGEALAHDYDLGGRPTRLESQAPQHDLYDQYGNPVPRPDVQIVYVDEVRYDQFGEPTFLRTGTGVETFYDREPDRRFLASIKTDSTAVMQFDGSISTARPLQRLEYTYDAVGNIRDALNRLYAPGGESAITDLGPPPENNVPGPSQHAYVYDGHYRLTGGVGTYIDRQENREFIYESDYAPNGNLLRKRQVTTTTGTTGNGRGSGGGGGSGNSKRGNGSGAEGDTTTERTCESNTGSGGGAFNQDPETTYVIADGDLVYETDPVGNDIHRLIRSGSRTYAYDANGNMAGWIQPCSRGKADISRTIEWDAENRVIRIAEGNNDTNYRYNAEGARTLERGPGGTTWFVNEHWRTVNEGLRYANVFLGEQRVASHRTSPQAPAPAPCVDEFENPCICLASGACVVTGISDCDLASQIFDPATSTCQPNESRTIHFLHDDLQGSLRVATDEVGGVFQYIDYLPTGRPWVAGQSSTKDTPYLFAGGWTDTTYDLVNFGERWYDPREENFLSPEPSLEESPYAVVDDPSVLSAYTYAASNPLRYIDPDGRTPKKATVKFDVGENSEKHQSGNISISLKQRAKRKAPYITFGGNYTNDAKGQQLQVAAQKHADRAERFSTILSIDTEDGTRKIRVFGITLDRFTKRGVRSDDAAPDPGPGNTGAANDDKLAPPAAPVVAPPKPDAKTKADQTSSNTGGGNSATGDTNDTGANKRPPKTSSNDQDKPPRKVNAASPKAKGAEGPE